MALGYAVGKADGRLGRRTIRAVKAFQRDHGARPDGVLSSALLATIRAAQPIAQEMRAAARPGARG
jgi:peptidoglycan hydrolase-like protein with peptidoglycan-binding domain